MEHYDVVLVGAGPANLSASYCLSMHTKIKFMMFESGNELSMRDRCSEIDSATGVGGAGFYSDGKFSYYPAGTNVWNLEQDLLNQSYEILKSIMHDISYVPPFLSSEYCHEEYHSEWKLKQYHVEYLGLDKRYELIKRLTSHGQIQCNTKILNITKLSNMYVLDCKNISDEIFYVSTANVILGGGRFMPLSFDKFTLSIPMEFKRVELGVRFEQSSNHPVYSSSCMTDPKFTMYDEAHDVEYRTFCWCRDGEVVLTNCDNVISCSGRSDCDTTGRSNFGFNIRMKQPDSMQYLHGAIMTKPFSIKYGDSTECTQESFTKTMTVIKKGLQLFCQTHNISINDLNNFTLHGPTIEGVGYYPITDENLKVCNENIWIVGDTGGKFRGIIPSMISGIYVAQLLQKIDFDK
jgi:uncharacterized protein